MVLSGVGTRCRAHDRDSLERLCRYIARPAVSNERLSVNDRGQVVYRLKHSFHDGTTHAVLKPLMTFETIVDLIGNTRTDAGLRVRAELDKRKCPTGVTATDAEMDALSLHRNELHGDWNYEVVRPSAVKLETFIRSRS